ncbi:MAG: hypothetical protein A3I26_03390 [Candidatus Yanofskybacteria bacterium RIFCSPLOWO2_02_FULL_43_10]|uniref:Uncharacterized protein n=1 Tax=Candidatus Yanofskybacteria bacterium RIFCSPLOWO2_12_FULL_43_11b TaxID=1802710 RepID=A0A1F8H864_9BACT|nr:MAG: hypothetical protein A2742_00525 [Candidatus Yanofskybacteria bacterium RIFCSPHIGHO2_01_FULL_43_32]OGN11250.1 MAG: hypothetical protein A3C69_00655 [Candidatus Yanofskybacteria bacterium RIFCSPHIGHO2_02_FULL_43_12]OGN17870.1 MAG: hypothetical protein A3E34_00325 [Candidatus Yanofskybacteria bacterium RIFCSPHIGHO2_12_FULL_43_11]OGN24171.1 MAG: hypothetical protein A2923_02465 [Candidatus Yanofskybacteria bacterium RIFCSPLOWO2_01_FULL_43_46]OGN28669.1 MAG: hypothetical protein A3I26_03390
MVKKRGGYFCPPFGLDTEFVVFDALDEGGPLIVGEEHGILRRVIAVADSHAVGLDSHSDASLRIVLGPRRNLEVPIANSDTTEHLFSFLQSLPTAL